VRLEANTKVVGGARAGGDDKDEGEELPVMEIGNRKATEVKDNKNSKNSKNEIEEKRAKFASRGLLKIRDW
jgi:hypothetical protein